MPRPALAQPIDLALRQAMVDEEAALWLQPARPMLIATSGTLFIGAGKPIAVKNIVMFEPRGGGVQAHPGG